jgi:UDPglucose 6-dehydrogenase
MHRLTVIGTGYLGAVHAACLACLGFEVLGTDIDPAAAAKAVAACPQLMQADSAEAAAQDADVLLVLTEWDEFRLADPDILGKAVRRRNVLDARHALDPGLWRAAGWTYRALGRP